MAQFLSDDWLKAAHDIYAAHAGESTAAAQDMQINLVVKEAPFGEGTIQAHLDSTGSETAIGAGHIDGATTTVTTDYATAKSIFVEQDQNVAMQAFMGGKIQITGDMTKLMMMMNQTPDAAALATANELKAMTD